MEQKKTDEAKNDSRSRFINFINTHYLGDVYLTDTVSYTITDVIKENILDRNFKFSVPYYSDGTEKIFFSLPFILADAVYRNTNIDTKDIHVQADNVASIDWVPLVRGAVRNYLKVNNFEETINDVRRELIDMGHVITKEADGDTNIVNLINVVRPAEIMDLQRGGLAEATYLNWDEMLENKEEWKDSWKEIEQIKGIADSIQRKTFRVYEWWTVDEFEVDGEKKQTKGCIKFLDCTIFESNIPSLPEDWIPYLELERFATPFTERVKNKNKLRKLRKAKIVSEGSDQVPIYPYEEQLLYKIPGRWIGMGYYELLRQEGKAFNRTMNEKLRYDELLHKGILVHTKSPFTANQKGSGRGLEADIINRIQTGTIISVKAGEKIDRLNLGSLTADFLATAEKWFDIAKKKVGISDASIGGSIGSATKATVAVIQEKQAKNAFDMVNEQQGIFFKRLFSRFKIVEIIEDITEEDWTKLIGDPDEFAKMEEAFIDNLVNVGVANAAATGQFVPQTSSLAPEEMTRIKTAVKVMRGRQGESRFAQLKAEMIKDFDWVISFIILNNAFDRQVALNALQEAINSVAANPMSELDMNKMIELKLDLLEVPYHTLRKSPEQIQADREQAMLAATGGSPMGTNPVEMAGKQFGQINQQQA